MAVGEHHDSESQRVTNAMIFERLGQVSKSLEQHVANDEKYWRDYEARLRSLETGQTERRTQVHTLAAEVEKLRGESKTWNILNSLGAVAAGIFAGLGWGK